MAKDDDEELRVVEGAQDEGETVTVDDEAAKAAAAAGAGDERTAQRDEDDDGGDDPAATEAIRAQRRLERKAKKLREHQARDRNRRELDMLRSRNEVLERRQSELDYRMRQNEWQSTNSELQQIEHSIRTADEVIAKGISEQDGVSVTEAQNIKRELEKARERLQYSKQQIAQGAQEVQRQYQAQQAPPQPQVDPQVASLADQWRSKNPWFKGGKADDDSAIVAALDERLSAEGLDPRQPEYWEMLTERVKERLPHRFNGNGAANGNGHEREERRGPAMANGGRERSLKPGEMYVSAERKQALIDAGVWDDSKLRAKYLKRYAEYDEAARRNV
jgi:hypothetical protein